MLKLIDSAEAEVLLVNGFVTNATKINERWGCVNVVLTERQQCLDQGKNVSAKSLQSPGGSS